MVPPPRRPNSTASNSAGIGQRGPIKSGTVQDPQRTASATPVSSASSSTHAPATTVERQPEAVLEFLLPPESLFFELKHLERQLDDRLLKNQQRLCDIQFKKERSPRRLLIRVGNTAQDQPALSSLNANQVTKIGSSVPSVDASSATYAAFTPIPPTAENEKPTTHLDEYAMTNTNDGDEPTRMFGNPPSWTLRLEGKLEPTVGRPSRYPTPPFTHWIKAVKVEFRDDDGRVVYMEEWNKEAANGKATEAIELRRQGSTPLQARVLVYPDYHVEKWKCSRALSDVINPMPLDDGGEDDNGDGEEEYMERDYRPLTASKAHVIVLLWQYIKLHKLQTSEKTVACDAALQRVFGQARISLGDIPSLIGQHLTVPDPIVIDYRLHLEVPSYQSTQAYDLWVEFDETTLRQPKLNHPALLTLSNDISSLDSRIQETADLLKAAVGNYRLLRAFGEDPVRCIRRLVRQQCRDIGQLTGDLSAVTVEDAFRDDLLQGPHVEHALVQYLFHKQ